MEAHSKLVDICVVCAIPDEVRAFLEGVQQQSEGIIEECISPRYQSGYRFTTIKNIKDELLNLHISWLPRYGPQEMTLHLSRILEEFQPRIVIMTGICAGDSRHVQLGDLVVAERTFTYDNGKFTLDEQGRSVHLHDTLTYQLDANILQYLGLFDDWESPVARLNRPLSSPEQHKRHRVECHIKPMASGSAVRADHPFEEVRVPVRGTVAIDMEGAALGLVMSRHPLIPWLVVKGVCDYADQDKNDIYHDYAARASAAYALSFIRAFVINERLPRLDGSSPSSRAGPPGVWNVPYRRNPFFTGREDLLTRLHERLGTTCAAALTQAKAISGLGGIGKTQTAVEYAYRFREEYAYVFWVQAASRDTLITDFVSVASLLGLPVQDEPDQIRNAAIKQWFSEHSGWLLILDNAEDMALMYEFLPTTHDRGHILLTTRAQATGAIAEPIAVEKLGLEEGVQLLLRRARIVDQAGAEDRLAARAIVEAMDGLPLALDQAGAYIEETQCSVSDYLRLYQTHQSLLLRRRGFAVDYPASVATTWSLSFEKVRQNNSAAIELLYLCAFLAPDAIPEEMITAGAVELGPGLQSATKDSLLFDETLGELLKYSLVDRNPETHTLTIHRLVQVVLKDNLNPDEQRVWAERAVRVVNHTFPQVFHASKWPLYDRYLPHALISVELIEQQKIEFAEAARLLNQIGLYLCERGRYAEAEPLYLRSLSIDEQIFGLEHVEVATILNNLAELYRKQGKFAQAELLCIQAWQMREKILGPSHADVAQSLNNLALLFFEKGKYFDAEPLADRALRIMEDGLGPEHVDVGAFLNTRATLYQVLGKYNEAQSVYERLLEIAQMSLGPEHPNVAKSLNNLALLSQWQGMYNKAEPLFLKALQKKEQALGPDHPDLAVSLNSLAEIYRVQGKFEVAEPLYERALKIVEKTFGQEHPLTSVILSNQALLSQDQGDYERAEDLNMQVLKNTERVLGPEHPSLATSLNNLADLYRTQERYKEAKPLYERALQIRKAALGSEHPEVAQVLHNLGELNRVQGDYKQAELLFEQARQLRERVLGPDHLDAGTSLYCLALVYYHQKSYVKAEPCYIKAKKIFEKALGQEHPNVANVLYTLALIYRAWGEYERAEPLFFRALVIFGRIHGLDAPDVKSRWSEYVTLLVAMKHNDPQRRLEGLKAKIRYREQLPAVHTRIESLS